jgi:hypothetical protein
VIERVVYYQFRSTLCSAREGNDPRNHTKPHEPDQFRSVCLRGSFLEVGNLSKSNTDQITHGSQDGPHPQSRIAEPNQSDRKRSQVEAVASFPESIDRIARHPKIRMSVQEILFGRQPMPVRLASNATNPEAFLPGARDSVGRSSGQRRAPPQVRRSSFPRRVESRNNLLWLDV